MIGVVEGVLGNVCIGSLQTGPDALRWLIGEFQGHLDFKKWSYSSFLSFLHANLTLYPKVSTLV